MRARVWAPRPQMVRVQIDGTVHAMTAGDDGWWEGPELTPGSRYGFLIDDDPTPRPDPRGRSLPDGVHGLSEAVDVEELVAVGADHERDWRGRAHGGERAVIYELHIGTFTPEGTFDSAIERLDHLVDLGVGFIEILPVNGFNGTHNWGYDGVAWFAVHEGYGGPAGYRRLVAAAHARGLAVIQDVVYNHLGPSGNYLPLFGPYLHSGSSNTWGDSVNLDEPEVRRYILDNAAMWMGEYGVDGLRLDAVHALVDTGSTGTHLLAELGAETDELSARLGRPLTLIAESDLNDPIMFTDRVEGGHGLTAQWSDDYHHAVHVAVSGETVGYYADFADPTALGKVWSRGFFHDGTYSSFREREHGRPIPPETEPWRLVTFSQDHDQIGNRAAGDRLTASLSTERLSVAAVLTVLAPGAPMLFMGEEWGATTPWQFFTSHPEPELGTATAEGRIAEFEKMGWDRDAVPDPQDPTTFANSKLDWSELDRPGHALLLEQYRTLIQLRDELPAPERMSDLTAEPGPHPGSWRLGRAGATVLVNLGETDWNVGPVDEMLFTTDASVQLSDLVLPPDSAVVLR